MPRLLEAALAWALDVSVLRGGLAVGNAWQLVLLGCAHTVRLLLCRLQDAMICARRYSLVDLLKCWSGWTGARQEAVVIAGRIAHAYDCEATWCDAGRVMSVVGKQCMRCCEESIRSIRRMGGVDAVACSYQCVLQQCNVLWPASVFTLCMYQVQVLGFVEKHNACCLYAGGNWFCVERFLH